MSDAPTPQAEKKDAELYDHPDYLAERIDMQKAFDFYAGKQDVMRSKYLIPYLLERTEAEGKAAFKQRQERTFYTNYFKCLVKLNLAYLFCVEPDVTAFIGEGKVFTEEESKNIDGTGTSLLDFIKEIARCSIMYPWFFANVDAPKAKLSTGSNLEAEKLGLRPYGAIWSPLEVVNWAEEQDDFAKFGKLTAVMREYIRLAKRKSIFDKPELETIRDVYLIENGDLQKITFRRKKNQALEVTRDPQTNQMKTGMESRWEEVARISVPGIPDLPIVRSKHPAWTDQLVPECERHYNLVSTYENILYFKGYPYLVISGNIKTDGNKVAAGENAIIWLEKDGAATSIPSDSSECVKSRVDAVRDTIFRLGLNQLRQLDGGSKQVQSDETIYADKEDAFSQVQSKMHEIEDTVNKVISLWAGFKGVEVPKDKFAFSAEFTRQGFDKFLEIYTSSYDMQQDVPEFQAELRKQLVSFAQIKREKAKEIMNKIDAVAKKPRPMQEQPRRAGMNGDKFMRGYDPQSQPAA